MTGLATSEKHMGLTCQVDDGIGLECEPYMPYCFLGGGIGCKLVCCIEKEGRRTLQKTLDWIESVMYKQIDSPTEA